MDDWTVIFVVVGIIVLAIGIIGGYMAYTLEAFDFFPVWMFVAFIGIILTLVGFAMGMKGNHGKE